jgi:transcriptional regulator with XRE-family HTH domain
MQLPLQKYGGNDIVPIGLSDGIQFLELISLCVFNSQGATQRMPAKRSDEADFSETAALITNAVDTYRVHLPLSVRRQWKESDLAKKIGIAASRLSEIKSGKWLPNLNECWKLSKELGVPVERIIQAAAKHRPKDYQDVIALIRAIEADTMHQQKERNYILNCLRYSASAEARRQHWEKSEAKQAADLILCTEFDVYTRAKYYADLVWDWYTAKKVGLDLARPERKTDEMATVTDEMAAVGS